MTSEALRYASLLELIARDLLSAFRHQLEMSFARDKIRHADRVLSDLTTAERAIPLERAKWLTLRSDARDELARLQDRREW